MNSRAFTLSLVIAGIAMFMVYSYIDGVESKFKQDFGSEVTVLVAQKDINKLDVIDSRMVRPMNVPKKFMMPGAFSSPEEVENTIATVPIKAGEQITKPRISYPDGARSGLSRQVTPGKRAFSLPADSIKSVSHLVKPGDRVDLIAVIDYANNNKQLLKSKTVLQDIYVLATGKFVSKDIPIEGLLVDNEIKAIKPSITHEYGSITLELTPFEVQKVLLLNTMGSEIYLSLRNNDDKAMERVAGTKLFDVLGEDAAEAKQFFAEQKAKGNRKN